MSRLCTTLSACIISCLFVSAAAMSPDDEPTTDNPAPTVDDTAESIAWFGRLDDAEAEAKRTGRPILLMSAAPQCSGAPGMW